MDQPNEKIVVLGAGFGGLRTSLLLAKNSKKVTLVDKNDYHTYQSMLYEVAVTTKELANYCDLKSILSFPIKDLIAKLPIDFILSEVTQLDIINGDIHFINHDSIKFDCLVIALGAETNYFNIPGLKENSLGFKTLIDALKIRDELTSQPLGYKPKLIIGGGGSTGVELAGEIQHAGLANVTLVQSPPNILLGFHPKLIKLAVKRLEDLGVRLVLDFITEVKDKKVFLKNSGQCDFDILIWAGGVQANYLVRDLPLKNDERGRIQVAKEMNCIPQTSDLQLTKKIYAIGDVVCFYNPLTGESVPGLASVAIQQAEVVVKNILGKKTIYHPKKFPYILPIGGKYALFQIGDRVIEGPGAWTLKLFIELGYFLKIMPWRMAFRVWFKGLRIFLENEKLG